jgi:hypothetical protein
VLVSAYRGGRGSIRCEPVDSTHRILVPKAALERFLASAGE